MMMNPLKLIPILILMITFSLSSIAGEFEHQVKENWEKWGPYKLKTVEIGMGEISRADTTFRNIVGSPTGTNFKYFEGSRIGLQVVSLGFVNGFQGKVDNSIHHKINTSLYFSAFQGDAIKSNIFFFNPKIQWL
ncbi:hypothetical protein [Grimontia sp. NTOU-MAR1]|uniref:hypothetical protein n=1 Tax=Grimontia sp. NTOU-MAR1 TaxID=3111011 RepID=UPI002DB61C77|nr:hypothetical protein [Grimontia sp. NTOU-MAR1]WRV98367.1 hypothetical protein VP504_02720 [Grimontia sp. NTOU-MAR1]